MNRENVDDVDLDLSSYQFYSAADDVSSTADSHVDDGNDDVMSSTWLCAVLVSLYAIIFALGVTGNSLVVHVVWRNKSLQTITNIFIANLAASDVMMCLLAVPFTPISGLLSDWIFGKALCHIVPMTMGTSIYVSTLTSTAVAVDRYIAIVHPFRARMTTGGCLLVIAGVWAASVTVTLPLAIHQTVNVSNETGIRVCLEDWPQPSIRRTFTLGSLVFQYLVPCVVIIVCYWRVSVALKRRALTKKGMMAGSKTMSARSAGTSSVNVERSAAGAVTPAVPDELAPPSATAASSAASRREQLEIQRNRRTNRMLIASVAIFVCCWLPLNIINLLLEYREEQISGPYFLLVFFVVHVFAMSSTVYNPFLYAWMNDAFRAEFTRALPRCLVASSCSRHLRPPAGAGDGTATAAETNGGGGGSRRRKAPGCSRDATTALTGVVNGKQASGGRELVKPALLVYDRSAGGGVAKRSPAAGIDAKEPEEVVKLISGSSDEIGTVTTTQC